MNYFVDEIFYLAIPVPFRLSWGKLGYSRHLLVKITDKKGNFGWGEGVLYKTTFGKLLPQIQAHGIKSISTGFEPAVSCALDMAEWDLKARVANKPLSFLLGAKLGSVNITEEIFIESAEKTEKQLKVILDHGTKSIKLKIGRSVDQDLRMIFMVNELAKDRLEIGLDSNRSYNLNEALELVSKIGDLSIKVLEEPINGSFADLALFKNQTKIPIMLDESIRSTEDLDNAISNNCFSELNIKLSRVGGISNALKYMEVCRQNKVGIYLGCNEELDIGMQAIAHLGASLPNVFGIEGVGPKRLKSQISGMNFNLSDGNLNLSRDAGLGIEEIDLSDVRRTGAFDNNSTENLLHQLLFICQDEFGVWKTRIENGLSFLTKIS